MIQDEILKNAKTKAHKAKQADIPPVHESKKPKKKEVTPVRESSRARKTVHEDKKAKKDENINTNW